MQTLFAPWRYQFISQANRESGCFLCKAASAPDDAERLVVFHDERYVVVLNRYPYNNGHIMVAPRAHGGQPGDLGPHHWEGFWPLVLRCQRVLTRVYQPDGFNCGMNLGAAAGAGVRDHMHFHLVPRWQGDANFMTTLAEVRVIPEELEATRQRLKLAFEEEEES